MVLLAEIPCIVSQELCQGSIPKPKPVHISLAGHFQQHFGPFLHVSPYRRIVATRVSTLK